MENHSFTGAMLRMYRLARNWSQETLCQGICTVSYLSKIEKGKAEANVHLLKDLFARMDISWQKLSQTESSEQCESIYEDIFADNQIPLQRLVEEGYFQRDPAEMGIQALDYLVQKSYCSKDSAVVPEVLQTLLDNRQKCLLYLLEGKPKAALQTYPCALAAMLAGAASYTNGKYTSALEELQRGYDMACQEGHVRIMLYCQIYMANCYSDLQNMPGMMDHCKIAKRLASALEEQELIESIEYNVASTQIESGAYEDAYRYFAARKDPDPMELHKLALCCEKLGKYGEALSALDAAEKHREGIVGPLCSLVRYRLEHPDYLKDAQYGELLIRIFRTLQTDYPAGYARFHLPWVEEWCTSNRQYRLAYELIRDFS